jgi:hypothetical protein
MVLDFTYKWAFATGYGRFFGRGFAAAAHGRSWPICDITG